MSAEEKFPNLLVVIGASAGGLQPIKTILGELPEDLQATVIVATHRDPALHDNVLADILERATDMDVQEPMENDHLNCATIYVGKPRDTVSVEGKSIHLKRLFDDFGRLHRIDDLFLSAAESARENTVGIILSGMLYDGVQGLEAIADEGGKCIVQDPAEARFDSMPKNALAAVDVDFVGSAEEIAELLIQLAAERSCQG